MQKQYHTLIETPEYRAAVKRCLEAEQPQDSLDKLGRVLDSAISPEQIETANRYRDLFWERERKTAIMNHVKENGLRRAIYSLCPALFL